MDVSATRATGAVDDRFADPEGTRNNVASGNSRPLSIPGTGGIDENHNTGGQAASRSAPRSQSGDPKNVVSNRLAHGESRGGGADLSQEKTTTSVEGGVIPKMHEYENSRDTVDTSLASQSPSPRDEGVTKNATTTTRVAPSTAAQAGNRPMHRLVVQGGGPASTALHSAHAPSEDFKDTASRTSTRSSVGRNHDEESSSIGEDEDGDDDGHGDSLDYDPSDGQGDAKASTSTGRYEGQPELKREKRLAMNRVSARERRRRKKLLIDSLQARVDKLEDEVQELDDTNTGLRHYIGKLEMDLMQAQSVLSDAGISTGAAAPPVVMGATPPINGVLGRGGASPSLRASKYPQSMPHASFPNPQPPMPSSTVGMAVQQRADEVLESLLAAQHRQRDAQSAVSMMHSGPASLGGSSPSSLFLRGQQHPMSLGNGPRGMGPMVALGAREEALESALLQEQHQQRREALLIQQLMGQKSLHGGPGFGRPGFQPHQGLPFANGSSVHGGDRMRPSETDPRSLAAATSRGALPVDVVASGGMKPQDGRVPYAPAMSRGQLHAEGEMSRMQWRQGPSSAGGRSAHDAAQGGKQPYKKRLKVKHPPP